MVKDRIHSERELSRLLCRRNIFETESNKSFYFCPFVLCCCDNMRKGTRHLFLYFSQRNFLRFLQCCGFGTRCLIDLWIQIRDTFLPDPDATHELSINVMSINTQILCQLTRIFFTCKKLNILNFVEKSSFVEKMENLPGESNKVPIYADVCKLNGKSAKNIARKSGKHNRSKNPSNWIRKGSVVFIRSQREVTSYSAHYSSLSLKKEDGEAV
jgi:hypothetical protein